MTFRIPLYVTCLLVVGSLAPIVIIPLISEFGWPSQLKYIILGLSTFIIAYTVWLLFWKLTVSDDGVFYSRINHELRLSWPEIAEWHYNRTPIYWSFWIKERNEEKHELRWILFNERRCRQFVEILKKKNIPGNITNA